MSEKRSFFTHETLEKNIGWLIICTILITLVWVAYAIVFFGTIMKRKTRHIYVANWFFGAYILTIAILHIVNNAEMPVGMWKSYSAYAGVQDAMVQW